MKVLLTGASGFIGGNVLRRLVRDGHDIVCPVRTRLDSRGRTDAPVGSGRIAVVQCDLTRRAALAWRLPTDVDAIINCASEAEVAASIANPQSHVKNNVAIAMNMLEFARNCDNLQQLVHLSTNEVNNLKSPYGASKLAQESLVHAWRECYGAPATVLTTRSVFGRGQPPTKFIPTIVRNLLAGEPIVMVGGVDVGRCWHPVDHLVKDIALLLEGGQARRPHYNSASTTLIRNIDIIFRIAKMLDVQPIITFADDSGRYAAGEPDVGGSAVNPVMDGLLFDHHLSATVQELAT